jgi:hypothetical protein
MIETLFGLGRLGHVNKKGLPHPLQLALFAREFSDVVVLRSGSKSRSGPNRGIIAVPAVLRFGTPKGAYIPGRGVPTPDGMVYKIPVGVNARVPVRTLRLSAAADATQHGYANCRDRRGVRSYGGRFERSYDSPKNRIIKPRRGGGAV